MKKILFGLAVYLSFISASVSQVPYYYYQVPSGTTSNLNDIEKLRSNSLPVFFICGNSGTLLNISNADSGCVNLSINTSINLNSILNYYLPIYPYYLLCNNGILFTKTNGGENWIQQYSGFSNNLYSGTFFYGNDYPSYILVGNNGIILKRFYFDTVWLPVQSNSTQNLKSVYSCGKYIWVAGDNGTILKSVDSALVWNQLNSGITNNLNSIKFIDTLKGYVVGSGGKILKTTNGGINWIQKTSNTTQDLNDITILKDTIIYIAGNKVTLYSTNDGENWIQDSGVPQYNFSACNFIFSNYYRKSIPFFVGEGGKIYKKTLDTNYHPNFETNLKPNNINAFFNLKGMFDYKSYYSYPASGFEWPKGTGKSAIYVAGICIGAYVNGQLREAMAAYDGEYRPGYCTNGNFYTNDYFKIYKINKSENNQTSWDWANWGQMVPYGAPFVDVNNNGIYESAIDTPGVRNAKETIFLCMTDANLYAHSSYVYYGGGTLPLGAEVHITAWAYDNIQGLEDVQFINYDIVNKSTSTWNRVKTGIFSDPDLGDPSDDFIGCDTALDLAYCYNSDNDDAGYGVNPPAVGFILLKSPLNRSVSPNIRLGMTSFVNVAKYNPVCENIGSSAYGAYLNMSGFKKDSTCYLDPTQMPPKKTKFCFPGMPQSSGWDEFDGTIWNCNHDSTGNIVSAQTGDRIFHMGSGADNFNILPGESQKFVIAQMITRGNNNLHSVILLKTLAAGVKNFYESNFPIGINQISSEIPKDFRLEQNYPNPFNPTTIIKYRIPKSSFVTLKVYDLLGREIETLVNDFQQAGIYETQFPEKYVHLSSGIYFYKLTAGDFTSVKRMLLIK